MKICVFGDSVTQASYVKNSWCNLLKWKLEEKAAKNNTSLNL